MNFAKNNKKSEMNQLTDAAAVNAVKRRSKFSRQNIKYQTRY
mgnify:CR=1 FL=1